MGGDEPAHTLIAAALSMGKSVVTANKHVIAHHGPELEAIARRTGAALRFEAAVGGGIPVLGPLAVDLAANRIDRVRGIVNGTTNYILSAMTDEARRSTTRPALAEAQRLGYAEADPAGDVEGFDAVNKLVILARLAFDRLARPGHDPDAPGRTAAPPGRASPLSAPRTRRRAGPWAVIIRLVATRALDATDGVLAAAVLPTAVPIARRSGDGRRPKPDRGRREPVGHVAFDGPGAGGAGDAVGGPRRPDRGRPGRRVDMGLAARRGAAASDVASRPRRVLDAASGVRYPIDD